MKKRKNPHAVALGRLGGLNSGGPREGAGRPRSDAPRCACGAMTLKCAEARRHKCEHAVSDAYDKLATGWV